MHMPKLRKLFVLSLLPMSLLLTACATQPQVSASACPSYPQMPYVTSPEPTGTFLTNAQQNIQGWQSELKSSMPKSGN